MTNLRERLLAERFGTVAAWELERDQLRWSPPARAAAGLPALPALSDRRSKRTVTHLLRADHHTARAILGGWAMPRATTADRRLAAILMYRTGRFDMAEIAERVGQTPRNVHRWVAGTGRLRLARPGRKPRRRAPLSARAA